MGQGFDGAAYIANPSTPHAAQAVVLLLLLSEQEGFEPPLPERVKRFSRPSL
jgi:hypothetical protein